MGRVTHFEIQADDPARAQKFYSEALGWEFSKWGDWDYWLIKTGPDGKPGINGGLLPRKGPINYVNTVEVASLDDSARKIEALGGKIVVPKMPIPGVGWLLYCQDTEGNVFGVMQPDSSA